MDDITKEILAEMVELSSSVPEQFQQKCFEIILQRHFAAKTLSAVPAISPPKLEPPLPGIPAKTKIVIPIDVKAFLSQFSLEEDVLWKCFFVEGSEIRPIYNLKTTIKAQAQVQLALLLALENALADGKFQFDVEKLRQKCEDLKCLDGPNFSSIMKKNLNLFKEAKKGEPLMLTPDGKSELADLLEELTSTNGEK